MNRRNFLKWSGSAVPLVAAFPGGAATLLSEKNSAIAKEVKPEMLFKEKADYTIHIGTGLIEVGPQSIISTTTYYTNYN